MTTREETQAIGEALIERFADLGGFDYDEPGEIDETGAPYITGGGETGADGFGMSLNPDGTDALEVTPPENPAEPWPYEIIRGGEVERAGVLPMSWDRWRELCEAPNRDPYRIGGKAAGELDHILRGVI